LAGNAIDVWTRDLMKGLRRASSLLPHGSRQSMAHGEGRLKPGGRFSQAQSISRASPAIGKKRIPGQHEQLGVELYSAERPLQLEAKPSVLARYSDGGRRRCTADRLRERLPICSWRAAASRRRRIAVRIALGGSRLAPDPADADGEPVLASLGAGIGLTLAF